MAISEYYAPTYVRFGIGAEAEVGRVLKKQGATRVLVHFGTASVKKSGLLTRVEDALRAEGLYFVELGGVVPNPRLSLVRRGIDLCKEEKIDFLLAVGGGSAIDSAKAIGYGVYGGGDVWDYYCGKRTIEGSLPVGAILTLAAAGSEMSNSSVITSDEGTPVYKRGCNSNYGRLRFALVNPALTYTVSAYQTSCGAVDIMMHTLERFFHRGETLALTDELSFALLRTVVTYAPRALKDPTDYDARANVTWASSLSHNGLMNAGNENAGDWACHQMEHELSARYDVAHGAGLSAIFASWARYVLPTDPGRFAALGRGVFGESDPLRAIGRFEDFFRSIGAPVDLPALGLHFTAEDCLDTARGVTFNGARTIGSFRVLNTDDIAAIFRAASHL